MKILILGFIVAMVGFTSGCGGGSMTTTISASGYGVVIVKLQ
jgi:hypothetical protein